MFLDPRIAVVLPKLSVSDLVGLWQSLRTVTTDEGTPLNGIVRQLMLWDRKELCKPRLITRAPHDHSRSLTVPDRSLTTTALHIVVAIPIRASWVIRFDLDLDYVFHETPQVIEMIKLFRLPRARASQS